MLTRTGMGMRSHLMRSHSMTRTRGSAASRRLSWNEKQMAMRAREVAEKERRSGGKGNGNSAAST